MAPTLLSGYPAEKQAMVDKARKVAEQIRALDPVAAHLIDLAIQAMLDGSRDSLRVDVGVRYKLEKFTGDKQPGAVPFEVIEGTG